MSQLLWTRRTQVARAWQPVALLAVFALTGFGTFASFMAGDPASATFMGGACCGLSSLVLIAPPLLALARRVDAQLLLDGSTLRCGNQPPIHAEGLRSWRVLTAQHSVDSGQGAVSRTPTLRVEISTATGETQAFTWSHPHPADADSLRRAMTDAFGAEG